MTIHNNATSYRKPHPLWWRDLLQLNNNLAHNYLWHHQKEMLWK